MNSGLSREPDAAALWAGIPLKNMGTLMPNEVATAVEIETEKQKDFYKMLAWMCYNCAVLTGVAMNDPKKFPSLEEAFPTLFEQKGQQKW